MGIVHHHGKRLAAIHFLKSSRHLLEMVNGFSNLLERTSTGKSRSRGRQYVVNVNAADQRCLNPYAAGRRDQIELRAVLLQVDIRRFEIAILYPVEDHLLA